MAVIYRNQPATRGIAPDPAAELSMPTDTEALGLSNYGDAAYFSRDFGRYT